MIQYADGVAFDARTPVDVSWLRAYGQVFHVFDRQDSGNLCFGVSGPYGKLFVKYAGAQPVNYAGRAEDAVAQLKQAVRLYQAFPHRALTPLRTHGAVADGYAAVFTWVDGPCLRSVPPDAGVLKRLCSLPLQSKLSMLDDLFDLHCLMAERGYVAVDFDDSNLLIDFNLGRCYLCDIDRYQLAPFANTRGHMPGRGFFRAPECYQMGTMIDQRTTVYEMGMLSQLFLGDADRGWDAPDLLRRVTLAAVNRRPEDRYPSMRTFLHAWRTAVRSSWIY